MSECYQVQFVNIYIRRSGVYVHSPNIYTKMFRKIQDGKCIVLIECVRCGRVQRKKGLPVPRV